MRSTKTVTSVSSMLPDMPSTLPFRFCTAMDPRSFHPLPSARTPPCCVKGAFRSSPALRYATPHRQRCHPVTPDIAPADSRCRFPAPRNRCQKAIASARYMRQYPRTVRWHHVSSRNWPRLRSCRLNPVRRPESRQDRLFDILTHLSRDSRLSGTKRSCEPIWTSEDINGLREYGSSNNGWRHTNH